MRNLSIIIITGLSGSGKGTAMNALEDAGYFCVDNMPVLLLPKFLELPSGSVSEIQNLALGMDLREKEFLEKYQETFDLLRKDGYCFKVFFLEAPEDVLLKRYSQTRRQHPVSRGKNLLECIRSEKEQLKGLRAIADVVIDTSDYTVHQLKDVIIQHAYPAVKVERMRIGILSALQLLCAMKSFGQPLSKLSTLMTVFPQVLINVQVRTKPDISTVPEVVKAIEIAEGGLGEKGRVLVRYSGTEPVCRVMVEGEKRETAEKYSRQIAEVIENELA